MDIRERKRKGRARGEDGSQERGELRVTGSKEKRMKWGASGNEEERENEKISIREEGRKCDGTIEGETSVRIEGNRGRVEEGKTGTSRTEVINTGRKKWKPGGRNLNGNEE